MKELILVFTLVLGNLILYSQDLPIDANTKRITFTEVVYVDDTTTTKDQLYSIAREWFAKTFNSANDVLQMDDRQAGKLIGKSNFEINRTAYLTDSRVEFTISVYLKDGQYKYEITGFNHISYKSGFSGGALEDDKPDCGSFSMAKKGWKQVKQQTKEVTVVLIANLKVAMNKNISNIDSEDW